jgi:hypothetical protein
MRIIDSGRTYVRVARDLSRHWERPLVTTAFKLVTSRLVYGRGPLEFDEFRFIDKPLRRWSEFTVRRELNALQDGVTPAEFRHLDDDKLAFTEHCEQSGLPVVPIVAVIASRSAKRTAFGKVPTARSGDELASILASIGDFDGFAKPLDAGQSYGAFGFGVRSGAVVSQEGTRTAHDFFEHCAASPFAPEGYLFQPRVVPHPALLPFMPGPGLGTVRILTFLMGDGDVVIPWAWLKMPAPGAECDDVRFGALVAAIEVETGALRPAVGATIDRPVVHVMDTHPVSGARITDTVLPYWPETRALVSRAAKAFDMLPALGWDVAITRDGPLFIETNVMFDSFERASEHGHDAELRRLFAQVTQGQGSRDVRASG